MTKAKEKPHSLKPELMKSLAAYVATGLIGAAATYAYSALNRLPSRALTIVPAGIHLIEGPTLSCDDAEFIKGRVNVYLDPEIAVPPCDTLLSKQQASQLAEGLGTAKTYYQSERISFFQKSLSRLSEIAKAPPSSDQKLRDNTMAAIGDLEFISRRAPANLDGPALLLWAQQRVSSVLNDVSAEFSRIEEIVTRLRGQGAQQARHTEIYFIATNASDVEFYIATSCSVVRAGSNIPIVLEKVDHDEVLSGALVYIPVLPGRGKLMRYTPKDESQMYALESPTKILMKCGLASGKSVETAEFDPVPFIEKETSYVPGLRPDHR